jgi:hypothetical protein
MKDKSATGWHFDPDNLTGREAVVIAAGFFLVVGGFTVLGGKGHVKYGGLTVSTALLFGYFLHDSREYLRNPRLWMLTACLLVLHLTAWIILLTHVEKWGLLWFNIMVLELPVFWHLRDRPGLLS